MLFLSLSHNYLNQILNTPIFILFTMLTTNIILIYDKNILTDNFNFPSHYCDLKLKPL